MMFERFTSPARVAVVAARQCARELHHDEITAGHVLVGLLEDGDGVAAKVLSQLGVERAALSALLAPYATGDTESLRTLGIDLDEVRRRAEAAFGPGALERPRRQRSGRFGHRDAGGGGHIPFDVEAKTALEGALRAAVARRDKFIGTEHLLLGLLATTPGTAMSLLRRLGVADDLEGITARVDHELGRAA